MPATPPSNEYTRVIGWVGSARVVSLTFDDGPGADTGRVLDILEHNHIQATFCQIGRQVGDFPATERRIATDGDTFCNHSWDHDEHLSTRSARAIDTEITSTQHAIQALTGVTPRYFRAPGGDWGSTGPMRSELARLHTVPLGWAVDPQDWRRPGAAAIVRTVLRTVTPGAVILLHDGGGNRSQTLAALPQIIAGLRNAGYSFVPLPPHPPA